MTTTIRPEKTDPETGDGLETEANDDEAEIAAEIPTQD
jgi:hypothetical protein